jgi:hypothetical protein
MIKQKRGWRLPLSLAEEVFNQILVKIGAMPDSIYELLTGFNSLEWRYLTQQCKQ